MEPVRVTGNYARQEVELAEKTYGLKIECVEGNPHPWGLDYALGMRAALNYVMSGGERSVAFVGGAALAGTHHFPAGSAVRPNPRAHTCGCDTPVRCQHVAPELIVFTPWARSPTAEEFAWYDESGAELLFINFRAKELSGSLFAGKVGYYFSGNRMVMTAPTGATHYLPFKPYLFGGQVTVPSGTLEVEHLVLTGDVQVAEMVRRPGAERTAALELWRGVPLSGYGTFAVPSLNSQNSGVVRASLVSWRAATVSCFGPLLIYSATEGMTQTVVVDAGLVAKYAARMVGEPRTAETYRGLVRNVRGDVAKCKHLPAEQQPYVVLYTALLAYTSMITDEMAALAEAHERDGVLWARHASTLQFNFPWFVTAEDLGGVAFGAVASTGFSAGAGWLYDWWESAGGGHATHTTMLMVAAAAADPTGFSALSLCGHMAAGAAAGVVGVMARRAWKRRVRRSTVQERPSMARDLPDPAFAFAHDDDMHAYVAPVTHVQPRKHGPTDFVKDDDAPQKDRSVVDASAAFLGKPAAPAMGLELIGFDGITGSYFASTAENEAIALRNRLTRAVPLPSKSMVKSAFETLRLRPTWQRLLAELRERPPHSDAQTFARWVARFPGPVADTLRKERHRVITDGHFRRSDFKSGSFVKRETHIGFKTPRGIITFRPAQHSFVGPLTWHVSVVLHEVLDEPDGTPGAFITGQVSAEEFGFWWDYWTKRLTIGGKAPYILSGDGVKLDAHFSSNDAVECNTLYYGQTGLTDLEREASQHLEHGVSGTSRHGVVFRTDDAMGSGADETFLFNTTAVAAKTQASTTVLLGEGLALAVNGDDVAGIIAAAAVDDDGGPTVYAAAMDSRMEQMGFTYSFKISQDLSEHDFCSRLLYPTPDGLLPGPMIGRTLGRAAWHLDWSNDGSQSSKSMAIGMLQDGYHVPFVREYFLRVLELCPGPLGGRPKPGMHAGRRHEYGPETWVFVERRYGLTPADLPPFIALLRGVRSLPAVVNWEPMERCWAIDTA